jgi:hypothetical protein
MGTTNTATVETMTPRDNAPGYPGAGEEIEMKKNRLFCVWIQSSNAAGRTIWSGDVALVNVTTMTRNGGFIRWEAQRGEDYNQLDEDNDLTTPVALFTSREQALEAALTARWNNQTVDVRPARGSVRSSGKVVPESASSWEA